MTNNNNICLDDYYIRKSSTNTSDIVSTEHNGLMTSSDKTKLNSLDVHPNNLPAYSLGLYKVATNTNGHITNATAVTQNDLANLGIGGQEVGTFAELQALITNASSGDVIVLDKDYKNTGSESQITISKSLTIIGNGYVIDGNNTSKIFFITNENSSGSGIVHTININGLYLINGVKGSGTNGGGICIDSPKDTKGTISNCVFNNNKNGAIFAGGNGKGWIITNCLFNNNSNEGQYASGGAIYTKANTLISDCVFNNNDSTKGGAIGIENYTTIINCNFNYNSANNGGAIYDFSNNNTVIRNCNFKDNVASSNGDNVYNANSNSLKIYNCHISTGLYNTVNYDYVTANHSHSFNDLTNKPSTTAITINYVDGTSTTLNVYHS